jgi:hypothetical protein
MQLLFSGLVNPILTQYGSQVLLWVGNWLDIELFYQKLEHVGRNKSWQRYQ